MTNQCVIPEKHKVVIKIKAGQAKSTGKFVFELFAQFLVVPVTEKIWDDADETVTIHSNDQTMEAYVYNSKQSNRVKVPIQDSFCDYMRAEKDALGQYTLSCEKVTPQQ